MNVSGSNPVPRQTPSVRTQPRPAADGDVRAMRQAFARVGGNGDAPTTPLLRGKAEKNGEGLKTTATPQAGTSDHADEAAEDGRLVVIPRGDRRGGSLLHDSDQEQTEGAPALAATAEAPVQPIAVPDAPAPHVDPAAFAQLMSQLWLREKSKGAKEVRVEFGADAWPATGARLVRNAAGTLDVQLHVGDGGALYQGDTLSGLSRQLSESGLAVGSVALREGAVA